MDPAALTALSALLGSVVGGSATMATSWLTLRTQGRRASIEAEINKREGLYVEFIAEGSKLLVEGLDHQIERAEPLYRLYAVLNRIRLRSSKLAAAESATTRIFGRYFGAKLSPEELRQTVLTRSHDPIKEFSEACRLELQRLQQRQV